MSGLPIYSPAIQTVSGMVHEGAWMQAPSKGNECHELP